MPDLCLINDSFLPSCLRMSRVIYFFKNLDGSEMMRSKANTVKTCKKNAEISQRAAFELYLSCYRLIKQL